MAVDVDGNIIVSDRGKLRKVTQDGVVTTLSTGYASSWEGIAIDPAGNIYGSGSSGFVSTSPTTWGTSIHELTASGVLQQLFLNWETSTSASIGIGSGGLAVDSKGNLFLADGGSNRIVKFTPGGNWTVLAGSGTRGNLDGTGTAASFDSSHGLAIDANDNLFINSDRSIRKIAPDGTVTTVVSQLESDTSAIAIDQSGNFYVAGYQKIYRISSGGSITSFAFPNTSDFITSLATDKNGNLYAGTRGLGAQIFKISF